MHGDRSGEDIGTGMENAVYYLKKNSNNKKHCVSCNLNAFSVYCLSEKFINKVRYKNG